MLSGVPERSSGAGGATERDGQTDVNYYYYSHLQTTFCSWMVCSTWGLVLAQAKGGDDILADLVLVF